jgi:hypothetical protein
MKRNDSTLHLSQQKAGGFRFLLAGSRTQIKEKKTPKKDLTPLSLLSAQHQELAHSLIINAH